MIVHRNEDNKRFFVKSKQTYEKEIYLNVKNVEIRKSISKLMLLSDKLKLSSFLSLLFQLCLFDSASFAFDMLFSVWNHWMLANFC